MKTRGDEFIGCLGNGKTEHELDSELEELDIDDTIEKGGTKKWKNKKLKNNL